MDKLDIFKKEIKKDWYIQALGATPVFINSAALSGFTMKKELGFEYSNFVFTFKKGLGEMWYLESDSNRIWEIIKKRLDLHPDYLKIIKKKYEKNIKRSEKFFERVKKSDLQMISGEELLKLMRESAKTITNSVGIAHILEAVGLQIEKEFDKELSKIIFDRKAFNQINVYLTTPRSLSFISREEEDLEKILTVPAKEKEEALARHQQKYFWIQSNYVGQKELGRNYFRKRLRDIKNPKTKEKRTFRNNQENKYYLSGKVRQMAGVIKLATVWQDERKENTLKAIGYLDKILGGIGKRTGINK